MASPDDYILIVEHDDDLREILAALLDEEGYASCTASSGEEALEFLRAANPPCLALLDQREPDMGDDGLVHALRTIRALATVPILVMTGDPRLVSDEADAVIRKPIDVAALLWVIDRHCGRRATLTRPAPG